MAKGRPREFDTEQALERAVQLFWRKGYEGTSLSDLTSALGITKSSLYAAFGNKEALFRLVMERYGARAGAYRVSAVQAATAREVAQQLLEGAARLHGDKSNPDGCLGVAGALICGDEADAVRKDLVARRQAAERAIRERLERAKAEGDLPASADPAALTLYLSAVLYGMSVLATGGATRDELFEVAEVALTQWPASPGVDLLIRPAPPSAPA